MNRIALAAFALATLSAAANAGPDYDRKLEAAAAKIVAEKMGDLRGTFADGEAPTMTAPLDHGSTASVHGRWVDGLAPAADIRFIVPRAL